jgi:phosphoserine phosphatase RsbX
MEVIKVSTVECGVGQFMLPGQNQSGDLHLVYSDGSSVLIAAMDGIGHGEEAAIAAKTAASVLLENVREPVISLVRCCHERLRATRGVTMSLASVDVANGMMTWIGIGNVQGILLRAPGTQGTTREMLLLRPGVVGSQLPALQASVVPVAPQDSVVFVTDGVRGEFAESLAALESPQRAAQRIIEQFKSGTDDALALVVRLGTNSS